MCIDPMSLGAIAGTLSTTMQAASAVMGVVGAANEVRVQNQKFALNQQAAGQSAMEQSGMILARERADMEDAANASRDAFIEGKRAEGLALASSQNEGNSTNLTLRDLVRQAVNNINAADINKRRRIQQGNEELNAIGSQYSNRVNQVSRGDPTNILSAAVSGLGGFMGGLNIKDYETSKALGNNAKYKGTSQGYRFSDDGLNF